MSLKRKCLSISDKKRIIEAVESSKKKKDVADSFQIPSSSLSTILKQKEAIFNKTDAEGSRKKNRPSEFSRLEQCLFTWFNQVRQQNIPVSGILIKEKAKSFAEILDISDFTASDGWLSNFKKRHNLVFRKICGESASVDNGICENWKVKLQYLLCEYDPKNVFNADETGLFFKCLPDRTLTYKNEKCHGGKLSKERVTLLFAVNMDGSEKLKPLFIGKSAKPRCYKNVKSLPVMYRNNRKSWMTTELWNEWLETLNNDMQKQRRKIIIFVDNCTAHNNLSTLSNVRIEFFQKAWNNVTVQTIRNCFRTCGFGKTEDEIAATLAVDNQWYRLSTVLVEQLSTFEEFVAIDDDSAVCFSQ
ncbi:tigger transposable element-derived protein 4-like [Daktulosphaira vitifoliae]|uniref:tigger transposable element-derived protein 4-like n=1 Tax=Daktulosphaira vitifoliae TaxID=58002 RepID=UPI0021A97852|nr:tigger transposable element-derived protein 4-like [Daktulosphaira vitifoliae]